MPRIARIGIVLVMCALASNVPAAGRKPWNANLVAKSISGPASVAPGQDIEVTVDIENTGTPVSHYTLSIQIVTADQTVTNLWTDVHPIHVIDSDPLGPRPVRFQVPELSGMTGVHSYKWKLAVTAGFDQDTSDNESVGNDVTISWSPPALVPNLRAVSISGPAAVFPTQEVPVVVAVASEGAFSPPYRLRVELRHVDALNQVAFDNLVPTTGTFQLTVRVPAWDEIFPAWDSTLFIAEQIPWSWWLVLAPAQGEVWLADNAVKGNDLTNDMFPRDLAAAFIAGPERASVGETLSAPVSFRVDKNSSSPMIDAYRYDVYLRRKNVDNDLISESPVHPGDNLSSIVDGVVTYFPPALPSYIGRGFYEWVLEIAYFADRVPTNNMVVGNEIAIGDPTINLQASSIQGPSTGRPGDVARVDFVVSDTGNLPSEEPYSWQIDLVQESWTDADGDAPTLRRMLFAAGSSTAAVSRSEEGQLPKDWDGSPCAWMLSILPTDSHDDPSDSTQRGNPLTSPIPDLNARLIVGPARVAEDEVVQVDFFVESLGLPLGKPYSYEIALRSSEEQGGKAFMLLSGSTRQLGLVSRSVRVPTQLERGEECRWLLELGAMELQPESNLSNNQLLGNSVHVDS